MVKLVPDLYVQIPAYRDRELAATLRSLYGQAARPGRLRVRVLWQHAADETLPDDVLCLPNLEIDRVPAEASEGCNWARHKLQLAWAGERYTLLLDSHHRFVRGWDRLAVGMLDGLRSSGTKRPILTAYLPGYRPDLPGSGRRVPYRIYPLGRREGVLMRLTSFPIQGWRTLDRPIEADFLSLHFLLADGAFNVDVPMDPAIYFFGDEVFTTLQAFAAGYHPFHPHRVIGWHAYDRSTRVPHWADHADWSERDRATMTRLKRHYRSGRRLDGVPGHRRTVANFEDRIGLKLIL